MVYFISRLCISKQSMFVTKIYILMNVYECYYHSTILYLLRSTLGFHLLHNSGKYLLILSSLLRDSKHVLIFRYTIYHSIFQLQTLNKSNRYVFCFLCINFQPFFFMMAWIIIYWFIIIIMAIHEIRTDKRKKTGCSRRQSHI